MAGKSGPTKINRSAKTGRIVTKEFAKKHPATTVTETIKKPSPKKTK